MSSEKGLAAHAETEKDSLVERLRLRFYRLIYSFHRKEEGIEAIETIIILVVAVIILIALITYFWPGVFQQLKDKIETLFQSSPSN
jgi:Flp pilus assembly pilin Flp